MKKLLLFICLLWSVITTNAQEGLTCSNAIEITLDKPCANNISQEGAYFWFKFTADQTTKRIELTNLSTSVGHVHGFALLEGSCGSSIILDSVKISISNDTLLTLLATNLTVGNEYYIATKKDEPNCTKCTNNVAQFNICVKNPNTPVLPYSFGVCNEQGCCIYSNPFGIDQNGNPIYPYSILDCNVTVYTCVNQPITFSHDQWNQNNFQPDLANMYYFQWDAVNSNLGVGNIEYTFDDFTCIYSTPTPIGTTNDLVLSYYHNGTLLVGVILHVIVLDELNANFSLLTSPACPAQLVCFNNSSTFPTNGPLVNCQWNFGDGQTSTSCLNGAICTSTICHSYDYPGSYSVVLTLDNGYCQDTYTHQITIQDINVNFSATKVCLGSTTQFADLSTCIGDFPTWYWDFGDGTISTIQNPTHIYSTAGTYNVTLNINGTTYSSFVTVYPLPVAPVITATGSLTICNTPNLSYQISNYSPYNTYSVSVSGGSMIGGISGTGAFNVSWISQSAGGTITIFVTDAKGCTNSTTITVQGCCVPSIAGAQNFINGNVSSMTSISGYTTLIGSIINVGSKTFYINGTFTVNADMRWINCEVFLAPNAKIIVSPGVKFTIVESHLSAGCNEMWDGIYANNSTSTVEIRKSWIEHAITAVNISNGTEHKLSSTLYNKNKTSILVQNYSGVYTPAVNAWIQGNVFTCRNYSGLTLPVFTSPSFNLPTDYSTYPTSTMITPYAGVRSVIGAELNKISNITTSYKIESNIFDFVTTGIKTTETHSTIYNNEFKLITSIAGAPAYGIYAIGKTPAPLPVSYKAIIGGTNSSQANKFNLCYIGVFTTNNMNADIVKNDFTTISAYAVHCEYSSKFNILNILNNNITNAQVGIHCYWNSFCQSTINENIIKVTVPLLFSNAVGIWMEELTATVTPTPFLYTAFNNRIENVRYGIRAYNLYKANIDNNRIEINPSGSLPRRGIEVLGNSATTVVDNRVKCVPANGNIQVGGIYASLSTNSYMSCNNIQDMGFAIQCAGPMNPSTVYNNTMKNDTRGIWLSNGGIIDQQGDATHPSYNKWQGTFNDQTFTSGTITLPTSGILSPFYVRNTPAFYNPTLNNNSGFPNTSISINPATGAGASPLCIVSPPPVVALRQQIVLDQLTFSTQELKWLSKHSVYSELLNDSSIYSGDLLLHNFKDSVEYAAMGKLKDVKKALGKRNLAFGSADLLTAISENASVLPAITPETESKVINGILLSNLQNNQSTFDASQLSILRAIANECPYEYGIAVYEARMLVQPYDSLLTVYENSCEGEQNRMMFSETNTTVTFREFTMYPNPNNGSMNLVYDIGAQDKGEVIIYDLSGRKINSYILNTNENTLRIDENALENGIYMYSILINGQIVQSDKIVIIK